MVYPKYNINIHDYWKQLTKFLFISFVFGGYLFCYVHPSSFNLLFNVFRNEATCNIFKDTGAIILFKGISIQTPL